MTPINMLGQPCPIPVIEAKKALKGLAPGESVSLLVDNDAARENLAKMARGLGHEFSHQLSGEGHIMVTITTALGAGPQAGPGALGLVVAIGRTVLGGGDEELGAALMKSFIYSLTELETPPEHLLFFNEGVRLAVEGSMALEDLGALAARGTTISSCGACLDYYGLTEKLRAGMVTNMFAIANTMAQAGRLINL